MPDPASPVCDSEQVQTLQLGWQPAIVLSAALAAGAVAAPSLSPGLGRRLRPYVRESAIVAGLYGLWQLAGSYSVANGDGAFTRARWIVRFERDWLPSERDAQQLIVHSQLLSRGANWYYAVMHFSMLGVLLLWLFVRHRDRYPRVRNVLVLLTAACLIIQFVPVAPPRLLPELGFVDTAARYGESVYSISGITVDQLSAMPSVHVGWAVLVAWAVLTVSPSRHRWWIVLHPILTVFVVVATANHFWLDGIVAIALLALSIAAVAGSARLFRSDDRDAGGGTFPHGHQRIRNGVESDGAGDQLVGPQR